MFGLTFEKLFVIVVVATFVVGPEQLPVYARKVADAVRALRAFVESSRLQAERDLGVPLARADWESLDPRQYDPRRIVRDALREPDPDARATEVSGPSDARVPDTEDARTHDAPRATGRWVIVGDSAHPRRVFVPDERSAA